MYFFLCCSMYCLFCDVLCIVCVYMCTVLLPPGGYPIAVKCVQYIISHIVCVCVYCFLSYLVKESQVSFPHYLTNGTIFEKKLLNTKCVFCFSVQLLSETFLILRRTERDITIKVQSCSRKVPLLSSHFNETWNFLNRFSKEHFIWNSIKLRSVEAELFRAKRHEDGRTDGRTDMTQLIVPFRNFANAPKIHFTSDRKLIASTLQKNNSVMVFIVWVVTRNT
jgi:hypothetical protein